MSRGRGPGALLILFLLVGGVLSTGSGAAGRPDLVVTVMNVESPGPLGVVPRQTALAVTILVANAGDATASDVFVEIYEIQPDGSKKALSSFRIATIAPGVSVLHRAYWMPYVDKIGDFDLAAVVDPYDSIEESEEMNNVRHARATSRLPAKGLVFPARSILAPTAGPLMLSGEWGAYFFDRFDRNNPAKGLLLDRAGNGRDLRLPARDIVDVGVADNGARLDGNTYYIIDWPGMDNYLNGASVSLWIKLDKRPKFGQFAWSVPAGECQRQALEVRPEGAVRLWAPTVAGGCLDYAQSIARLQPGQWAHVAVAWSADKAVLYVNGELEAAYVQSSRPWPMRGSFYLGALNQGAPAQAPSAYLDDAVVDELRLYQRTLTAADVAALYAAGQKIYVG